MDKLTISTIYTQRVTRIENDRKISYCERTNLLIAYCATIFKRYSKENKTI